MDGWRVNILEMGPGVGNDDLLVQPVVTQVQHSQMDVVPQCRLCHLVNLVVTYCELLCKKKSHKQTRWHHSCPNVSFSGLHHSKEKNFPYRDTRAPEEREEDPEGWNGSGCCQAEGPEVSWGVWRRVATHWPHGECSHSAPDSTGSSDLEENNRMRSFMQSYTSTYTDTSPTFKTVGGECTELVIVHLEHLQRWRQCGDPGNLVAIEVQVLQRGQVLHDTQQTRGGGETKQTKCLLVSKSIILYLDLPSRKQSQLTEIPQMSESQMCASHPWHLSCDIFSMASQCGSSVTAAAVDVCQVRAVDWICCSIPPASPSVPCHYWDMTKNEIKKTTKNL